MSSLNADQFGKHEAQHVANPDPNRDPKSMEAWPSYCSACQLDKARVAAKTIIPKRYKGTHA